MITKKWVLLINAVSYCSFKQIFVQEIPRKGEIINDSETDQLYLVIGIQWNTNTPNAVADICVKEISKSYARNILTTTDD